MRILADLRGERLRLPLPTKKRPRREAVKTVLDYANPKLPRMTRAVGREAEKSQVCRQGAVKLPPSTKVLYCRGKFVVAGFWNSHKGPLMLQQYCQAMTFTGRGS